VDWRHHAACVGYDEDLFFPLGSTEASDAEGDRAKAVCGSCPVRKSCLEWAPEVGVDDGIFGGLTAGERRALKRRTRVTSGA